MSLTVVEQLLFNYFKIVSVSELEDTQNMYKEIIESHGNKENPANNLANALMSINRIIKSYDLEIMEAVDEVTMKKVHCLIATNASSVTEKASFYNRQTYEILSKIIQECVMSDSGSVTEASCLNFTIGNERNPATVRECLEKLKKDKWLVCKDEKISLGTRCKLELELSIKKQYPNHVKSCGLCKMFLVQGFACSNCENHVHFHCVRRYYKINKMNPSSKTCPICKEETNRAGNSVEMKTPRRGADEPPAKRSKSFVGNRSRQE